MSCRRASRLFSKALGQRNVLVHDRGLLTLSSVEGSTQPPLVQDTLPAYFAKEIVGKHRERPALISRHENPRPFGGPLSRNLGRTDCLAWDYDEFSRHVDAVARGLLSMGVKKGDRVAVIMGNSSAYASLQWACASIGAILVTINPAYRVSELINTLKVVGVSHLLLVPCIRTSSYLNMLADELPALANSPPSSIQEESLPELRNLVVVDNTHDPVHFQKHMDTMKCTTDFREILVWREDSKEQKILKEIGKTLHKDEVINLQFTSGTTGLPKAVSLTHHNLLNNGLSIGRCMDINETDILCKVPIQAPCLSAHFTWGQATSRRSSTALMSNLAFWTHGACIVYPSEIFNPQRIVDTVAEERCTALHGVPTHFIGVLSELKWREEKGEKPDMSQLRTGIAAGSPIPIELMRTLVEKMNLRDLTIAYGMTETSPVSFQTTTKDPLIKRVETVGKVQPHVKAKIINPEGEVVPVNTPGEIFIAGYLVQKGYWGDEEQTKIVMKRHPGDDETLWMHTGDEGIMDEEGYLRIVGRIKDIIIRGGENLFPVQIENVLHAHPGVREAAAVAVPDTRYGEVVGAWIVRQPDAPAVSREEIRKWVSVRMNPQNAPAWVWFVAEDDVPAQELPKTASGKVQKHVLRGWSKELAQKGVGRTQVL
ncbi:acetyl-CoA synthetase-like protein [Gloeophyllum trabeum ATCC 11539]|uniref:Acetyl-CoA synthetase-like protein n=1 Tax=Gloeophyllum trabeum (strain ATCC 11539 / FP-39264 / Madison 617) TaxID=670483 RepID=S7Q134_GLOTA|nr:acetyl-CoA synthetase-like protein [Gloeophyllum trabeum ATCC 11539]EPQ53656.1 acetyl-CoA synthetase-like protein [Gloeophyllum trabeum ATCC 11539]